MYSLHIFVFFSSCDHWYTPLSARAYVRACVRGAPFFCSRISSDLHTPTGALVYGIGEAAVVVSQRYLVSTFFFASPEVASHSPTTRLREGGETGEGGDEEAEEHGGGEKEGISEAKHSNNSPTGNLTVAFGTW